MREIFNMLNTTPWGFDKEYNEVKVIDALQKLQVETTNFQEKNPRGGINTTVLHLACEKGLPKVVKFLLDRGCDANCLTNPEHSETPLFYAAKARQWNLGSERDNNLYANIAVIIQLLAEKKANFYHQSKNGQTAVYCAVRSGHIKTTQALLRAASRQERNTEKKKASDTNSNQNKKLFAKSVKYSELESASVWGSAPLITMLINHGADVNKSIDGLSPLYHALVSGCTLSGAQKLLESGADASFCTSDDQTLLMMAAMGVSLLIEQDSKRDECTKLCRFMGELIEKGGEKLVTKADNKGDTALHYLGHVYCRETRQKQARLLAFNYLVLQGANPRAKNKKHQTALDVINEERMELDLKEDHITKLLNHREQTQNTFESAPNAPDAPLEHTPPSGP